MIFFYDDNDNTTAYDALLCTSGVLKSAAYIYKLLQL
jgi:hypothetical protein